jgi:predicted DNA-binding transcriptional regulator AlpA
MLTLAEVPEMLRIYRSTDWAIQSRGEFPVPILRIGSSLRVVRAHLEYFLVTGEEVTFPFKGRIGFNVVLGT